jgi:hypothetical protein
MPTGSSAGVSARITNSDRRKEHGVQRPYIQVALLAGLIAASGEMPSSQGKDNTPPPGSIALFNGKDLTGWQALLELPGLKSGAGLDPAEP